MLKINPLCATEIAVFIHLNDFEMYPILFFVYFAPCLILRTNIYCIKINLANYFSCVHILSCGLNLPTYIRLMIVIFRDTLLLFFYFLRNLDKRLARIFLHGVYSLLETVSVELMKEKSKVGRKGDLVLSYTFYLFDTCYLTKSFFPCQLHANFLRTQN